MKLWIKIIKSSGSGSPVFHTFKSQVNDIDAHPGSVIWALEIKRQLQTSGHRHFWHNQFEYIPYFQVLIKRKNRDQLQ